MHMSSRVQVILSDEEREAFRQQGCAPCSGVNDAAICLSLCGFPLCRDGGRDGNRLVVGIWRGRVVVVRVQRVAGYVG